MDENRYQMNLLFTGKDVELLMDAAKRYKRKPTQLGKLVIQDWLRAVTAAGLPLMIDMVPVETFKHLETKGEEDPHA